MFTVPPLSKSIGVALIELASSYADRIEFSADIANLAIRFVARSFICIAVARHTTVARHLSWGALVAGHTVSATKLHQRLNGCVGALCVALLSALISIVGTTLHQHALHADIQIAFIAAVAPRPNGQFTITSIAGEQVRAFLGHGLVRKWVALFALRHVACLRLEFVAHGALRAFSDATCGYERRS